MRSAATTRSAAPPNQLHAVAPGSRYAITLQPILGQEEEAWIRQVVADLDLDKPAGCGGLAVKRTKKEDLYRT